MIKPFAIVVGATAVLLAGCADPRSRTSEGNEIACAQSPLQFATQTKPSVWGDCAHRVFDEGKGTGRIHYETFYRYAEDQRGFLKVMYSRSFRKTFSEPADVKTRVKHSWKSLEGKSNSWIDGDRIEADGRKYDTAAFQLSDGRHCTGFNSYWAPRDAGFSNSLWGYFCGGNQRHSWDDQLAVLSAIKIEE